ncbi:hypothetical protein, partial [Mesorhizobium sp. M7A.F.Ca.CA.004.11.2.1]|uniref:hypothetical protein n=1 Tax=Mesorhizobium sp. M7A.F.Ca.CA.004.11.2.1 TaxID=2496699 RepID=UPI0019D24AB6
FQVRRGRMAGKLQPGRRCQRSGQKSVSHFGSSQNLKRYRFSIRQLRGLCNPSTKHPRYFFGLRTNSHG